MSDIDWKREFQALGIPGVRAQLMTNRWDNEKRAAAREWLERSDAHAWAAKHGGGDSKAEPVTTFAAFRRYRWVYYVAGGALGLLGLSQMFAGGIL